MTKVVISGTGVFTPPYSVSNAELVETFNKYVHTFNAENAAAIERGEMEPLVESNADFILKASGIESRYVMNKSGIVDPEIMAPRLAQRANEEPSILAEMAVDAANKALA
ncbi:MAG: beta-ketoacyl-ACP synthase III, partial [Alphaproteobacteria bacterium HGW-Alphaproteobacteria-12]